MDDYKTSKYNAKKNQTITQNVSHIYNIPMYICAYTYYSEIAQFHFTIQQYNIILWNIILFLILSYVYN